MDYLGYLKPGTVLDTLALAKDRLKPSAADYAQKIFEGVQYYQQAKAAKADQALKERYASVAEREAKQKEDYGNKALKLQELQQEHQKNLAMVQTGTELFNLATQMAQNGATEDQIFGHITQTYGNNPLAMQTAEAMKAMGPLGFSGIVAKAKQQADYQRESINLLKAQIVSAGKMDKLHDSLIPVNASQARLNDAMAHSYRNPQSQQPSLTPDQEYLLADEISAKLIGQYTDKDNKIHPLAKQLLESLKGDYKSNLAKSMIDRKIEQYFPSAPTPQPPRQPEDGKDNSYLDKPGPSTKPPQAKPSAGSSRSGIGRMSDALMGTGGEPIVDIPKDTKRIEATPETTAAINNFDKYVRPDLEARGYPPEAINRILVQQLISEFGGLP